MTKQLLRPRLRLVLARTLALTPSLRTFLRVFCAIAIWLVAVAMTCMILLSKSFWAAFFTTVEVRHFMPL
jgi:ABC-type transporter Mla maintaining outer membrane lipid asymmetry permease subunit MlaE